MAKAKVAKSKLYRLEEGKLQRLRSTCPRCGPGTFMANHGNRLTCGKCGYVEFKSSV